VGWAFKTLLSVLELESALKFGISPFSLSAAEEQFKSCHAIVCATGDSNAVPFLCVAILSLN
jgi:hypothetical protein